jgi:hypothetical protein
MFHENIYLFYFIILIMINPREFIRRLVKVLILLSITLMALMNTNKLNINDILMVVSIVSITYVILETLTPSIEIKRLE